MFTERADKHRLNRDLARRAKVRPALTAHGETGVVLRLGHVLTVLTETETITLAIRLIDSLDHHTEGNPNG